ncbi:TnsA endonuclease N-terminal domain-containing protein [Nostoc sp. C057]|uniref:TnsA endonuclease N-terminal domain-containing protein n=1 Tax=Nostoc sp. C057 TaxID=2576903 RepID=UPI0015C3BFF5|nr:TnsA endonuclease N-terminal domain-containing protein [Nostoc sp. C057]
MLTFEEFEQWCSQLKLTQNTRSLIAQIRLSPPSRRVQGNYGNVCGNYCSQKMGHTIQFESHRGELAHIIDKLEHNRQVLEYYDQPPPIELNYISKSNRQVRTSHTPDFFVIEVNWVGWEEFKPISELIKKHNNNQTATSKMKQEIGFVHLEKNMLKNTDLTIG